MWGNSSLVTIMSRINYKRSTGVNYSSSAIVYTFPFASFPLFYILYKTTKARCCSFSSKGSTTIFQRYGFSRWNDRKHSSFTTSLSPPPSTPVSSFYLRQREARLLKFLPFVGLNFLSLSKRRRRRRKNIVMLRFFPLPENCDTKISFVSFLSQI